MKDFHSSLDANSCRSSGEAKAENHKFRRLHGMILVHHVGTHPQSCDHMVLRDTWVLATQLAEKEKNQTNQLQTKWPWEVNQGLADEAWTVVN